MTNQTVILAAGKGTRMGGNIPKVLVMLKDKPLILYLLHSLEKVTQLIKPVVVVGYESEKVQGVLGNSYTYAFQNKQQGTAQAVLAAKNFIKAENFLVLYGDMPFIKAESIRALMKLHREKNSNISMLTAVAPNFEGMYKSLLSYGRIIRNSENSIIKVIEYKDASEEQKQIKEINPGIYMFNTKWFFSHVGKISNQNAQGEYYLTDIVEVALDHGQKVNNLQVDAKEVIGINSREDLEMAEKVL
jgi:bifunctional UDP-N-acetylglucosamine pyrophosphorylase / glucosamine-1-phosphate N-acetyltransferase